MIKLLFIVFSVPNSGNGISKKIQAQVEGLKNAGIDVSLCHFLDNAGERYWAVNGIEIAKIGRGINARVKFYTGFKPVFKYIVKERINVVYFRYVHNATYFMLNFLKKLKERDIPVFLEIPTYPYDGEYSNASVLKKLQMALERNARKQFKKYIKRIVTFSDHKDIFGVETINLSNSVDLNHIPLNSVIEHEGVRFIGVANLSFWHGFDRFIHGLNKYYHNNPQRMVYFDIVGDGKIIDELKGLVSKYNLCEKVVFHGLLSGTQLDKVFHYADIGVGCLGCHRKNIKEVKSLKNVEYAARGLPFIYSEKNDDFDSKDYVIKITPDETPIDIDYVIEAFDKVRVSPYQIRSSIIDLTWDCQMKKVAAAILNR